MFDSSMKSYIKFITIYIFIQILTGSSSADSLHYLEPGDSIENLAPGLRIFCHNAKSKYFIHTWRTLIMNLHTDLDTYDLYDGKTPTEVMEKHDINQRSWKFNWFGTKKSKELRINPFEDTCIGVFTYPYNNYRYKMSMTLIKIDSWKVLMTIGGIVLFWSAKKLSRNTLFYYLTGVTLGVMFSVLILVWFVGKLLGRGKTMYLMIGTGWAMSSWLARVLWENAQIILHQYKDYVFWYFLVTSLISFLVCYRIGPVTNDRTKKIIQWFLQASGLLIIYCSSYFTEASLSFCVLNFIIYNFPIAVYYKSKSYWKKMFPERRKLLTENEFRLQAIRETNKALNELKGYCSSPESNPWKTVLRLKDPIRFAKFMEGESHLSEHESSEHDLEITRLIEECEYTEDEYDEDDY
ncbi:nuclear envelope integral membrane protein [Microplitis demolitor]|uniref:nuclear envelope integral membrane protein n=1 Tax=Microplitis demolitor TaxID=69319 RepID=UPI0004CDBFBB|nr:nuclear envelope integral membrane protein [Microplitis demolitor]